MDDLDDILAVLNLVQAEIHEDAAEAAVDAAAAGASDDQLMPDKKRNLHPSVDGRPGHKRPCKGAAFVRMAACRMEEEKQEPLHTAVQVSDWNGPISHWRPTALALLCRPLGLLPPERCSHKPWRFRRMVACPRR